MTLLDVAVPTIDAIRANRARLGDLVVTTPIRHLVDHALSVAVGPTTQVWLKEELFQRTGSFKPRGALSVMLDLDPAALDAASPECLPATTPFRWGTPPTSWEPRPRS